MRVDKREIDKDTGEQSCQLTVMPDEVFTARFVKANTPFEALDHMISESGLGTFEYFNSSEADEFIAIHTRFKTMSEFSEEAIAEYVRNLDTSRLT